MGAGYNHRAKKERNKHTLTIVVRFFKEKRFNYYWVLFFRWLHNGSSNMAVLEVSLLTGFRPDIESLERLLQHNHLQLKMYEIQGRKILFYFDEVSWWTVESDHYFGFCFFIWCEEPNEQAHMGKNPFFSGAKQLFDVHQFRSLQNVCCWENTTGSSQSLWLLRTW